MPKIYDANKKTYSGRHDSRGCHLPGILFVFGNQRTDRRMSALAHDKRNFPACVFASSRFVGNSAKRKKFIKVLIETPL